MTDEPGRPRIIGTLRSVDGRGVVRMEDRLETSAEDLWSALTDPRRLARWLGDVEGELKPDGAFRARFFSSGWEGTGRVEACEPRQRLLVRTRDTDEPGEGTIEVTLRPDGDGTILVWEERGMPASHLAGYGAGIQTHVEDLAAHIRGEERCDAQARFAELFPAYQAVAPDAG